MPPTFVFEKERCSGRGKVTAYPSWKPEFTLGFSGVRDSQPFVFSVVCCISLFVLYRLTMLSVRLRFTASNYPIVVWYVFCGLNRLYKE